MIKQYYSAKTHYPPRKNACFFCLFPCLDVFRSWNLQALGVVSRLGPWVHTDHLTAVKLSGTQVQWKNLNKL